MTIRTSFVETFGEENATRVEEAAISHLGGPFDIHSNDKWGDDPFQYLFMVCISRDCLTRWRSHHGIDASYEDILAWALENANLHEYSGDIPDYMAIILGAYSPWINWEKSDTSEPEGTDGWRKRNLDWAHMSEAEFEAHSIVNTENIRVMAEEGVEGLKNRLRKEGPL